MKKTIFLFLFLLSFSATSQASHKFTLIEILDGNTSQYGYPVVGGANARAVMEALDNNPSFRGSDLYFSIEDGYNASWQTPPNTDRPVYKQFLANVLEGDKMPILRILHELYGKPVAAGFALGLD